MGNGYAPGVVAQHLIDEIASIRNTAQAIARDHTDPIIGDTTTVDEGSDNDVSRITVETGGNAPGMDLTEAARFVPEEYTPDFTVPAVGFSIKSTAAYLRDLFGLSTMVAGELISDEPGGRPVLRLRIDGQLIPRICAAGGGDTMEQVLQYGAREILCTLRPLTLAAYYYATRESSLAHRLIMLARANETNVETEVQALLLEGHLAALEGRLDGAIEKYSEAAEHGSKSPQVYSSWGNVLRANGDHERAIDKYRQALAVDSAFEPAYRSWGNALYLQGEYDAAIEKYSQAVAHNPMSVRAYYSWGNALRANGDHEGAIDKYRQALVIDDTFAPAYTGWGNVLYVMMDYEGAIERYRMAVEHNPRYYIAYFNWGNVLSEMERYGEAIGKYALAAQHRPEFARVYRLWGEALCAMGEEGEAMKRFAMAIELGGDDEMTMCPEA